MRRVTAPHHPQTFLLTLVFLGILAISGAKAWLRAGQIESFPSACDPFGYLYSAKEIREFWTKGEPPSFKLTHAPIQELQKDLEVSGIPAHEWGLALGPHAVSLQKNGAIGTQYLPGSGLWLSLMPQGNEIAIWNRLVILGIVFGAAAWILWLRKKSLNFGSAGLAIAWSAHSVLVILEYLGIRSFSINVQIPFLIGMGLMLGNSISLPVFMSFATWIRVPLIFHLPALTYWLLRENRGRTLRVFLIYTSLGLLPLLFYQKWMTGSLFSNTYGPYYAPGVNFDLGQVLHHLWYYLHPSGGGGKFNWTLIGMGFLCLSSWRYPRNEWKFLGLLFFPVLGFFLLHPITTPYYLVPTLVLILAFLLQMVLTAEPRPTSWAKALRGFVGGVLILWSVANVLTVIKSVKDGPAQKVYSENLKIPEEVLDPKAWILSDDYSGTFLYFWDHPGLKLHFASERAQAWILNWMKERGDPVYFVSGGDGQGALRSALEKNGANLVQVGAVWRGDMIFRVVGAGRSSD